MIPIRDLFEAHLTVKDLRDSMEFFGGLLGLPLAQVFPERKVAFYWIGSPGNSMLGIWEAGATPQRLSLHVAFSVDLPELLDAPDRLRRAGITPLDFWRNPTHEPVVLAWMPAASVYFLDPSGNLLEFISMLPDPPRPERGVLGYSNWLDAHGVARGAAKRSGHGPLKIAPLAVARSYAPSILDWIATLRRNARDNDRSTFDMCGSDTSVGPRVKPSTYASGIVPLINRRITEVHLLQPLDLRFATHSDIRAVSGLEQSGITGLEREW